METSRKQTEGRGTEEGGRERVAVKMEVESGDGWRDKQGGRERIAYYEIGKRRRRLVGGDERLTREGWSEDRAP